MKLSTIQKLQHFRIFLTMAANHWMFFAAYVFAMLIFLSQTDRIFPSLLLYALIGLFPYLFWLCDRYLKNSFLYLAGCGGILAIWTFLPLSWHYILIGAIYAIAYLFGSIKRRFSEEDDPLTELPIPLSVGMSFVGIFFAHYVMGTGWDSRIYGAMILAGALYFLELYVSRLMYFARVNDSSTGYMPLMEMFRSGFSLTLVFSAVLGIVIFLTSQFRLIGVWAQRLKELLRSFIRWFFSLFPEGAEEMEKPEPPLSSGPVGQTPFLPIEDAEPAPFWDILTRIFMVLVMVAILFLIVNGLRKLFLLLLRFRKEDFAEEEEEEGITDIHEELQHGGGLFHLQYAPFSGTLDNDEKIRRHYQRTVRRKFPLLTGNRNLNPGFYTAREVEKLDEAQGWASIYEKARYSPDSASDQDWTDFKGRLR